MNGLFASYFETNEINWYKLYNRCLEFEIFFGIYYFLLSLEKNFKN